MLPHNVFPRIEPIAATEPRVKRLLEIYERELAAAAQEPGLELNENGPPIDLRTLLGEMAALKSEVRKETETSRELHGSLKEALRSLHGVVDSAQRREAQLREENSQQRKKLEFQAAMKLIEVADRLRPALAQAEKLAKTRVRWFRRGFSAEAAALAEGLRLSLKRLEGELRSYGVERMATQGELFDPHWMQALGTVHMQQRREDEIIEEITAGYRDVDGIIRPAQVVVNRKGELKG
jgi:molecular chaperone GrpE